MTERALLNRLGRELDALSTQLSARAPRAAPPATPPVSPLALQALLDESLALFAALRRRSLRRHARRFVTARWTLADMVGHLATWAAEFRRQAEQALRDEPFAEAIPFALSVIGPNAWNEARAAEQRRRPLATVLAEFERETAALRDLVAALPAESLYAPRELPLAPSGDPDERLRGNLALIVAGKCDHDRYHLARLSAWLDRIEEDEA